jgi:hypothetical protein
VFWKSYFINFTEEKARTVHRNFLAAYGTTRHEVPLVQRVGFEAAVSGGGVSEGRD